LTMIATTVKGNITDQTKSQRTALEKVSVWMGKGSVQPNGL
jgi:hypothetical protein